MNQKTFLDRLATLAKFCGVTLQQDIIRFYDQVFREIGYGEGVRAIEQTIVSRRSRDPFPSVADLKKIACREVDDMDEAVEAANRIIEAVTKFGYRKPEEAKAWMGDIAWYVVSKNSTWQDFCSSLLTKDVPMYRAQFRDLALSAIRRYKAGLLNVAPTFKALSGNSGLARINALVSETTRKIGGTHGQGESGRDHAATGAAREGERTADDRDVPPERG